MKNKLKNLLFIFAIFTGVELHAQLNIGRNCSPQADANVKNLEFGDELLYWKTEQDKMAFGANISAAPSGTVEPTILEPGFKNSVGYRIYANYRTPDRCWKIGLAYANIPAKATSLTVNDPALIATNFVTLFPSNFPLIAALGGAPFSTVQARWDSTFNYLDLDVSRNFQCGSMFKITPNIGLRGVWIDQTFAYNGSGPIAAFTTTLQDRTSGLGLEGGIKGSLDFDFGLSICARVGGSLLYSQFRNKGEIGIFVADELVAINGYNDTNYNAIPSIDTYIGAEYILEFKKFALTGHAGWEQHVFFGTNQFSYGSKGNMTMQGLTVGGSLIY